MALDQKYLYPFFGPVAVDLKPLNYLPWGARPKKTVQHNFGLAPFGPKIFGLKTFGAEKFGLAVPSLSKRLWCHIQQVVKLTFLTHEYMSYRLL